MHPVLDPAVRRLCAAVIAAVLAAAVGEPAVAGIEDRCCSPVIVKRGVAKYSLADAKPALIRAAWLEGSARSIARLKVRTVRAAARRGVLYVRLTDLRWESGRRKHGSRRGRHRARAPTAGGSSPKLVLSYRTMSAPRSERLPMISGTAQEGQTLIPDRWSAPSPAPDPTSTKLSWAPPALSNPITINVSDTQYLVSMDTTKDYIVKIGHNRPCAAAGSNQSGLWLQGGHNVVLIGGRISIPCESTSYGRAGLKIRAATGTVHVEGLQIDNSGGYLSDGVDIAAPDATVQLENLRVGPVWEWTTAHPDIVQVQGGVKELRIDGITGTTTYQGIFLKDEDGLVNGPTALRRVNVHTLSGLGVYEPMTVLWQETKDIPVSVRDFYADRSGGTRDLMVIAHPMGDYVADGDASRRAALSDDGTYIYWPASNITGVVRDGNPPSGDFVPEGFAGQGYVSPGYR